MSIGLQFFEQKRVVFLDSIATGSVDPEAGMTVVSLVQESFQENYIQK